MVMVSDNTAEPHDLSPRPSCRLPEPMFSAIVVGVSSASFIRGAPSNQRKQNIHFVPPPDEMIHSPSAA